MPFAESEAGPSIAIAAYTPSKRSAFVEAAINRRRRTCSGFGDRHLKEVPLPSDKTQQSMARNPTFII